MAPKSFKKYIGSPLSSFQEQSAGVGEWIPIISNGKIEGFYHPYKDKSFYGGKEKQAREFFLFHTNYVTYLSRNNLWRIQSLERYANKINLQSKINKLSNFMESKGGLFIGNDGDSGFYKDGNGDMQFISGTSAIHYRYVLKNNKYQFNITLLNDVLTITSYYKDKCIADMQINI
jgi:hypothetical protein